jgi:mannose-6-phosphate isomerase
MSHLLRFVPIYQTRVWGGRRLETKLGRRLPDAQPYGESWELVDRPEAQSVIAAGPLAGHSLNELWRTEREAVFGEAWMRVPAERFPLLIKILDCSDDLSIQVHPPAAEAAALGGEPKTEMWYVADAEAGAKLYAGLKAGVRQKAFREALAQGAVADCVHVLHPAEGDSLHVPSGRLHALGRGLLIYEIQQNSDTTYRVFDWNRPGLDGKPRELHVQESLVSIDFEDDEPALHSAGGLLSSCEHFEVRHSSTGDPPLQPGCRLIMAIKSVQWHGEELLPGMVALQPANVQPQDPIGEWLEIGLGR